MNDDMAQKMADLPTDREVTEVSKMNDLRPNERATLDVRLNDLLKFLNAPGRDSMTPELSQEAIQRLERCEAALFAAGNMVGHARRMQIMVDV